MRVTGIGFIGTENSHTRHFIRFLNEEGRHPGVRAVALADGHTERNAELADVGGIETIVTEPAELIGVADAAIISTRDGARHREQAEPLLAAGMPVLVDKPLATTPADAAAILDAAADAGAVVYSSSALRAVPQIAELISEGADSGPLRSLHIVGPGDPDSPYSGLFFYGIHHVEAALELLGNPAVASGEIAATVQHHGDTTTALLRIADVDVTLTFVTPTDTERVPFHLTAVHTNGVVTRPIALHPDYNAPALATFVEAISSGKSPVSRETMMAPVVVLSAIVEALEATRQVQS
ncbi:Gfo/Idh/MocA family protein [Ruania rhizosphaerae]|uniref:Gfo/Idh/MocA family protein n=1 Tax=Ruania rhizosphaerae TaxID=1840413 RepID=UPI0013597AD3|nr:Gfo/Idh/MocA family oxidoreductase [Ruania rhizosphaerae]